MNAPEDSQDGPNNPPEPPVAQKPKPLFIPKAFLQAGAGVLKRAMGFRGSDERLGQPENVVDIEDVYDG